MKKSWIIVFSLITLSLIIFSISLGSLSLNFYSKYNNLRMDPLGISGNTQSDTGEYDFLLIGDSLIQNWKIDGFSSLNKGIGSQTSTQVLYRAQMLDDTVHAKKAIICVGGNDLKYLRLNPDSSSTVIEKAVQNIQGIIDAVSDNCDTVYVMTIPPVSSVPFYMKPLKSAKALLNSLNSINEIILNELDNNVKAIDTAKAISPLPKEDVYAADNIHLSQKSYECIFQLIK